MEACLRTRAQIGAAAAVTADAGVRAAAIGEVVMALDAVDVAVLVVREVEHQALAARNEGPVQRESRARQQERSASATNTSTRSPAPWP